jgi:hypothetical protein
MASSVFVLVYLTEIDPPRTAGANLLLLRLPGLPFVLDAGHLLRRILLVTKQPRVSSIPSPLPCMPCIADSRKRSKETRSETKTKTEKKVQFWSVSRWPFSTQILAGIVHISTSFLFL